MFMIATNNTRGLYHRLQVANKLLKGSHDKDEKVALFNYIANLYYSIGRVSNMEINASEKKVFGSHKNFRKLMRRFDLYKLKMLENCVKYKDFHSDFLGDILVVVEDDINELEDRKPIDTSSLSEDDFYTIFFDFMKTYHLEKLFDKFIKEKRIYKIIGDCDISLGFTLFNPINHDSDIFVKDFGYDINSLFILAHGFGHVYDFNHFDRAVSFYNQYFHQSFYGEVLPKTFERLFLNYLFQNNILDNEAIDKLFEMELLNYDYLLGSYILSLLDGKLLIDEKYRTLSYQDLINRIKKYFISEEEIMLYIQNITYFDVGEDFNYTYGNILSLYLKGSIEEDGFDNPMMNDFLEKRNNLFTPEFLSRWDITPSGYQKKHSMDMKILKK